MTDKQFTDTPLITPDTLRLKREDLCDILPRWAFDFTQASGGEDPLGEDVTLFRMNTHKAYVMQAPTVFLAIICELTRYPGASVALNDNGGTRASSTKPYPKLTMGGDNFTLRRLSVDAGAGVVVKSIKRKVKRRAGSLLLEVDNLHPDNYHIGTAGKSTRDARADVTNHARNLAQAYARANPEKKVDVETYLANIKALLDLHDEHCGLTTQAA